MRIELTKDELIEIIQERFSGVIDDAEVEFEIYDGHDFIETTDIKVVVSKKTRYY